MMTSLVTSDSLLALDIGTIYTRALLFDVITGRYRFVASGSAKTTTGAPYLDAGEGARVALNRLAELTGRVLLGNNDNLITPTRPDGSGVDTFVLTMSAGKPLKVVAVGLLEEVSLESARNLAETTYANIVGTLSLNDRRSQEARIDTILKVRPDMIIMAGGIEGGASKSIRNLLEAIGLSCFLLPKRQRPPILYAGNQMMHKEVEGSLGGITDLFLAPNIRPTWEIEQLAPAQKILMQMFGKVRSKQIHSINELGAWAQGRLMPTAVAFERVVRFLSKVYDPSKGVLGIDVGASSTTIASAFDGRSSLGVYPQLGLGVNLPRQLRLSRIEDITRWLTEDVADDTIQDYVYNKRAYPASLPATIEELAIEHAFARQVMRFAVKRMARNFPKNGSKKYSGILPWFEPVLATGSVLTEAPTHGHSMLMLLDGLQPAGVTTILLDQNNLVPALGAAADVNPLLAVQVLGSNTILNLGAVIAPVGNARIGTPILRAQVTYESGREVDLQVKYGSIDLIALPMSEAATIRLQPLQRFDVGMGPGRGGRIKVVGGSLGIVIDARGRPLQLNLDPARQREQNKNWLRMLGS
jgi:uncharacterized protein (TIGR01319 family)